MDSKETAKKEIFTIVARGLDNWKVLIQLGFDELLNNRILLAKLFEVKKHLSEEEGIPLALLSYDGIVERRQLDSEMYVTVRMIRLPLEKGEPTICFKEAVAEDGTPYSDMTAEIDIYPLDSLENIITLKKVLATIRQSGIADDMLNPWFIRQTVRQITDSMRSVKNIQIAEGTLPEVGQDAHVEFFFPAQPSEKDATEYYGSRRVKKGDLICRKTPVQVGKNPGKNVKGEVIPPLKGFDVKLKVQKGICLSSDELQAYAEEEGLVVIRWVEVEKNLPHGKKVIPAEVQLKVNPVLKIKGQETVDLITSHAVEVEGNLKIGSRIITDGEVYISGSVEEGTTIKSLDDITVVGDVAGSDLSSDMNVITRGNVADSKIVAKENVIMGGEVRQAKVVGKNVTAKRILGSNVVSQHQLMVDALDDDENEVFSSITVGAREFLHSRYNENREFLEHAKANLERIIEIVGDEYSDSVTHSNIQQQWVRFCSEARKAKRKYSRQQLTDLRTLFQNIPALRNIINEKEEENNKIEEHMKNSVDEEAVIVIRQRVGKHQKVTLGGITTTLERSEGETRISNKDKKS
ncbi:hypothetical protein AMJ86_02280 [bacterium SM23_57]|nr:MAG: hypothetical protein AMJ86_02280 [bacterium SM23_57]